MTHHRKLLCIRTQISKVTDEIAKFVKYFEISLTYKTIMIEFPGHFFPLSEFSYKLIRFLLHSSIVKSDIEICKNIPK